MKVEKAEAALLELKRALKERKGSEELSKLSKEFYNHLPHKSNETISDKSAIAKKQNICQVLHCFISHPLILHLLY